MLQICKKCGEKIPWRSLIDGKLRTVRGRKFCYDCSPFNGGNCKDLTITDEERKEKLKQQTKEKVQRYRDKHPYFIRDMQRKMREERKIKLVEMLGGKCKECGYNKCPRCMHFHHKDSSTKKFAISTKGLCSKWEVLVEEVLKCDLLCPTCHCEIHKISTPS